MKNLTLFDTQAHEIKTTCRTCEHRQRHQCGGKVIQYCGVRKSKLTWNGLLKIKCKTAACAIYEPVKSNLSWQNTNTDSTQ